MEFNQVTFREAMGLPKNYVDRILDQNILAEHFKNLQPCSTAELVTLAESPEQPFLKRYAAGTLLSFLGDPRINLTQPHMITIPGNIVTIGIDKFDVEIIFNKYKNLGVKKEWIAKEAPKFSANVTPFRIMKYCVTNGEYKTFLQETASASFPSSWNFGYQSPQYDNHPVYSVTVEDAENYAKWLSKKLKRKFRLPSEIEWEYAAAGLEAREFPWGEEYLLDHANTVEMKIFDTTPVGIFPKGYSCFGVADMSGNVEEYVADNYQPYHNGEIVNDDLLQTSDVYRVTRGGGFTRNCDLCRCKRRHGNYQSALYPFGFRLVE